MNHFSFTYVTGESHYSKQKNHTARGRAFGSTAVTSIATWPCSIRGISVSTTSITGALTLFTYRVTTSSAVPACTNCICSCELAMAR